MSKNKQRLFACLILLTANLFACQNESSKETAGDNVTSLSSTTEISHQTNIDSSIKVTSNTTLDSLQGVWMGYGDHNDIVIIKGNQYIETYKGEPDTLISKIIFTDTCIDDNPTYDYVSRLDDIKQNGKHFISLNTKDSSSNCVSIDEFDGKFLELSYHGHIHDFHKKSK